MHERACGESGNKVQYSVAQVEKIRGTLWLSAAFLLCWCLCSHCRRSVFTRHFTFVSGCWTAHRKDASGVNIPAAAHACNFHYTSAPLLVWTTVTASGSSRSRNLCPSGLMMAFVCVGHMLSSFLESDIHRHSGPFWRLLQPMQEWIKRWLSGLFKTLRAPPFPF